MSEFFSKLQELDALTGYQEAEVGRNFVCFRENKTGILCMDSFDRGGLEEILDMGRKFLPKIPLLPLETPHGIRYFPSDEKKTLLYFYGLPAPLRELRKKEDIIHYVTFRDDLLERKKEVDYLEYSPQGKDWYLRDFRSYLLSCGIYYPYEDEESFLDYYAELPVFIDEDRLEGDLKKAYESFSADRLMIDILSREADERRYRYAKRFDGFSLNELLLYFLDGSEDEKLDSVAGTNEALRKDYSNMLRCFVLGLIQICKDKYMRMRIKQDPSVENFFLPKQVPQRDLLSYPGFVSDMYSVDGKKYFFPESAKKRISYLSEVTMLENPHFPLPVLYARLGLPYQGYLQLLTKKDVTSENLIRKLDFRKEIVYPIGDYSSYKRVDILGCVDDQSKEHLESYLERLLLDEGIDYSLFPATDKEEGYCIIVHPSTKRNEELKKIFDKARCPLMDYYFPYCLKKGIPEFPSLKAFLEELDKVSDEMACRFFFESFTGETIEENVYFLLEQFPVESPSDECMDFFHYLFSRLIESAREEFRDKLALSNQWQALAILDRKENPDQSYEKNLPAPYVSFGFYGYAFQLDLFSKPYLCSCQRESIEKAARHYGEIYQRMHQAFSPKNKIDLVDFNHYLVDRLGLPKILLPLLKYDRPLLPQLPFLDSICHLCHDAIPLRHETADGYSFQKVNELFTYVRACGARHGVYLPQSPFSLPTLDEIQNRYFTAAFEGLFPGDRGLSDPKIDDYLQMPYQAIAAVLALYDGDFLILESGMDQLLSLRNDQDHFTYGMVLGTDRQTPEMLVAAPQVFLRLSRFYLNLAIAYAVDCAKKEIDGLESGTYLNAIPIKGLLHPLICPGMIFDAYQDEEGGEYFFSSRDRDAMEKTMNFFARSYEAKMKDPVMLTALILALSGFPLPFILDCLKKGVSVDQTNVPTFLEQLRFEDDIKGQNYRLRTPVPSPDHPFHYVCQGPDVWLSHARNEMAHQGFLLPLYYSLSDLSFDPNYRYDLSAYSSAHIPFFYTFTYENNYFLEQCLGEDDQLFEQYTKDFLNVVKDDAGKEAIRLVKEKRKENKSLMYHLYDELGAKDNFYLSLLKEFPDLVLCDNKEEVMNRILGFLTFLGEKVIRQYMDYASAGGR